MRLLRCLLAVGSAAVMAGTLTFAAGPAATTAARGAGHARPAPSARFLRQARSALVRYLRRSHPQIMLVHPRGTRPTITGTTNSASFNWSGYADTSTQNGAFTRVSGSWKTPAVSCSKEDRLTSEWVGLDGFNANSGTVEQVGTLDWCYQGTASYFTWYEMFPAGTVNVGTSLKPGDKITASVTRSNTTYTLQVVDATHTRNSFTKTKTCPATTCLANSAEWIAERPAFQIGIAPLANYGTWTLSSGKVTFHGNHETIGTVPNSKIKMLDATQAYALSTPSALTKAKDGFTATWHDSY
jgi:hypothetical protein